MYLLDTNIWLERLLNQQQSAVVEQFLNQICTQDLHLSDFTLHSIALALTRRKEFEAFLTFVEDVLIEGEVVLLRLQPEDLELVVEALQQQKLDYDDAYQYAIAHKYNLALVSFDADFDRTSRGRQTPAQVLQSIRNS